MLDAMNFLSKKQSLCKRGMDLFLSLLFLPFLIVPILVLIIGASIDTQQFGLFFQKRVGQHGVLFTIYKIRTHQITGNISKYSKKIRKLKFDELPEEVLELNPCETLPTLFDRGMVAFSPVEQSVVPANVCRKVVWTSDSGCPDVLSD